MIALLIIGGVFGYAVIAGLTSTLFNDDRWGDRDAAYLAGAFWPVLLPFVIGLNFKKWARRPKFPKATAKEIEC